MLETIGNCLMIAAALIVLGWIIVYFAALLEDLDGRQRGGDRGRRLAEGGRLYGPDAGAEHARRGRGSDRRGGLRISAHGRDEMARCEEMRSEVRGQRSARPETSDR